MTKEAVFAKVQPLFITYKIKKIILYKVFFINSNLNKFSNSSFN